MSETMSAYGSTCGSSGHSNWHEHDGVHVYCDGGLLKIRGVTAYRSLSEIPEHVLPGRMVIVSAAFQINSGSVSLGFRYKTFAGVSTDWLISSQTAGSSGSAQGVLPADAQYLMAPIIRCDSCNLSNYNWLSAGTYYRVTEKKITPGYGASAISYKYHYVAPATNDVDHSVKAQLGALDRLYDPRYGSYRGNAMVEETGPDGRVTQTFFNQQDGLVGNQSASIVSTRQPYHFEYIWFGGDPGDFQEDFSGPSLDTNNWTTPGSYPAGSGGYLDRVVSGYTPYTITNPTTSWGAYLKRSIGFETSKSVVAQFKLHGTGTETVVWLENEAAGSSDPNFRRWGIYFQATASNGQTTYKILKNVCTGAQTNNDFLMDGKLDAWYVLQLTIDASGKNLIHIWERENPANHVMYQQAMTNPAGYSWNFAQYTRGGYSMLDEYNEETILSVQRSTYTVDTLPGMSNPPFSVALIYNIRFSEYYPDTKIYRTYLTTEDAFQFEGKGTFMGKHIEHVYNSALQGGAQYGNQTNQIEYEWTDVNNDGWFKKAGTPPNDKDVDLKGLRFSQAQYFPNTSGVYMVGLPAYEAWLKCTPLADGVTCNTGSLVPDNWLGQNIYFYDNHLSWNTAPTQGAVTAKRTLVSVTSSLSTLNDETYGYDTWGNRNLVRRYFTLGQGANAPIGGSSPSYTETTTTYDPNYHTYPVAETVAANAGGTLEDRTTDWTYNYSCGKPNTESDPNDTTANDTTITVEYDDFCRIKSLTRPGDSNKTLIVSYNDFAYRDTGKPYWFEVKQLVSGSDYFTLRKFYDGAGKLIQTQTVGAQIYNPNLSGNETKTVVVNYAVEYDAINHWTKTKQTTPYADAQAPDYISPTWTNYTTSITDVLGRVIEVEGPDGTSQTSSYSLVSIPDVNPGPGYYLKTDQRDGLNNLTQQWTNVWGKMVWIKPATGPDVKYKYNPLGLLTYAYYGLTGVTTMGYDLAGRKTSMVDPDMGSWSYQYDGLGNLKQQTDARGCITTLDYDLQSRLTGKIYSGTPADCDTTADVTYTYDDGTNGKGRRTGMSLADGSVSATWTYDARGRMRTEQKTIAGSGTFQTQWDYNSADTVTYQRYPGGSDNSVGEQVSFEYYAPQRALKSVTGGDGTPYLALAGYDVEGRLIRRELNGTTVPNVQLVTKNTYYPWTTQSGQMGYQQGGRLQSTGTNPSTNPSTKLQSLAYSYDANGNILSITDSRTGTHDDPLTFGYDAANRLDWMNINGTLADDPTYDGEGRLTHKGNTSTQLAYASAGHLHAVSGIGTNEYTYDANGNMATRKINGVTYDLTYDAENRLISYRDRENGCSSTCAIFVYDDAGQRVKGTVNGVTTVYIGNYYELQGTTTRKYYFAGSQRIAMRENGTLFFLLTDYLGGMNITVNSSGANTNEVRYSAWGETRYPSGAKINGVGYTGQYSDSYINLLWYGSRWYDPALGRFVSPDSIVPSAGEGGNPNAVGYVGKANYSALVVDYHEYQLVGQLNQENQDRLQDPNTRLPGVPANPLAFDRYSYCLNNPIVYTDPTGHDPNGIFNITGSNWSDYSGHATHNKDLMSRNAYTWTFAGTLVGGALSGAAATLVSGPVTGGIIGLAGAAVGGGIGFAVGGVPYVWEMEDTLFWMSDVIGNPEPNSNYKVTIFHNSGPAEGNPTSKGYTICINNQCKAVSDVVGRELRKSFNQTETDRKEKKLPE